MIAKIKIKLKNFRLSNNESQDMLYKFNSDQNFSYGTPGGEHLDQSSPF